MRLIFNTPEEADAVRKAIAKSRPAIPDDLLDAISENFGSMAETTGEYDITPH